MIPSPLSADKAGLIIKEVKGRDDIVKYVMDFKFGPDLSHLATYFDIEAEGRAAAFEAVNFMSTTIAGIEAEMKLKESLRKNPSKTKTVRHLIVSRRGRTPPEMMIEIGRRLLALAGLSNQRAILAVHEDTENTHLHIAVDCIDENGKQIQLNAGYTKILWSHINAKLCHEFGFAPEDRLGFYADDSGVYNDHGIAVRDAEFQLTGVVPFPTRSPNPRAIDEFEHKTGFRSPLRDLKEIAFEARETAKSMQQFVDIMACHGFVYQPCGVGAEFRSADGSRTKASVIHRGFSKNNLLRHFRADAIPTPTVATGVPHFQPLDSAAAALAREVRLASPADILQTPLTDANDLQRLIEQKAQISAGLELFSGTGMEGQFTWKIDALTLAQTAGREQKRGRPRKLIHQADDSYPPISRGNFVGLLIAPNLSLDAMYEVEIWNSGDTLFATNDAITVMRGQDRVATFSPSLIVLHSRDKDDIKQALIIAQRQWGKVELFGSREFRAAATRIAAAEGIAVANPSLVGRMQALWDERYAMLADQYKRLANAGTRLSAAMQQQLAMGSARLTKSMSKLSERVQLGQIARQLDLMSAAQPLPRIAMDLHNRARAEAKLAEETARKLMEQQRAEQQQRAEREQRESQARRHLATLREQSRPLDRQIPSSAKPANLPVLPSDSQQAVSVHPEADNVSSPLTKPVPTQSPSLVTARTPALVPVSISASHRDANLTPAQRAVYANAIARARSWPSKPMGQKLESAQSIAERAPSTSTQPSDFDVIAAALSSGQAIGEVHQGQLHARILGQPTQYVETVPPDQLLPVIDACVQNQIQVRKILFDCGYGNIWPTTNGRFLAQVGHEKTAFAAEKFYQDDTMRKLMDRELMAFANFEAKYTRRRETPATSSFTDTVASLGHGVEQSAVSTPLSLSHPKPKLPVKEKQASTAPMQSPVLVDADERQRQLRRAIARRFYSLSWQAHDYRRGDAPPPFWDAEPKTDSPRLANEVPVLPGVAHQSPPVTVGSANQEQAQNAARQAAIAKFLGQ